MTKTIGKNEKIISIENVSKSFGSYQALADINLTIDKGEIITLLGPSGCGKTTLMRLIAGFEGVTEGTIKIDGIDVAGLPPEKRPVNMVFQRYALFPHLDVYENVAYGLRVKKLAKNEIDEKVRRMLSIVQLGQLSHRYINELSGGQSQRVALARALVNEPKVLLLDEPLAALDLKIRQHMLVEMKRIHAQTGATFVYVTHDQDEALVLSDRIVLIDKGKIVQIDEPHRMYAHPKSLFAAKFLGETNLFEATTTKAHGSDSVAVTVSGLKFEASQDNRMAMGQEVFVSIRPESFCFRPPEGRCRSMKASVIDEVFIGSRSFLTVRAPDGTEFRVQVQRGAFAPPINTERLVDVYWSNQDVSIFPAQ